MEVIEFEAKLIQIQPEVDLTTETNEVDRNLVGGELLLLIPLCFLAAWAIAIAFFTALSNKKQQINIQYFSKVPCRSCKFFKDNPYLKCAVHPTIAMTDKASDCSDYYNPNASESK